MYLKIPKNRQPQPTFPTNPAPRPITDPLAIQQTLTLVHQFGMFCIPPAQPNFPTMLSFVVYAEPCMDPRYQEGFIYWMERFYLYEEEPAELLSSRDHATGTDLIRTMQLLDGPELRGWQVMKGKQQKTGE